MVMFESIRQVLSSTEQFVFVELFSVSQVPVRCSQWAAHWIHKSLIQHSNSAPYRGSTGLDPQQVKNMGTQDHQSTLHFLVSSSPSGGLVYAQSLFLVKLQPEGTGSRAVTGNYQYVPRACMGCRLQDDRYGAKGEGSPVVG